MAEHPTRQEILDTNDDDDLIIQHWCDDIVPKLKQAIASSLQHAMHQKPQTINTDRIKFKWSTSTKFTGKMQGPILIVVNSQVLQLNSLSIAINFGYKQKKSVMDLFWELFNSKLSFGKDVKDPKKFWKLFHEGSWDNAVNIFHTPTRRELETSAPILAKKITDDELRSVPDELSNYFEYIRHLAFEPENYEHDTSLQIFPKSSNFGELVSLDGTQVDPKLATVMPHAIADTLSQFN